MDYLIRNNNKSCYKTLDVIDSISDPLEGCSDDHGEKFYLLDNVVFAEPLKPVNTEGSSEIKDIEYTVIGEVIIEKRKGNKNKIYHVKIDQSCKCPQNSCGKSFKSTALAKAHIRKVHCAVRQFVCEICGADFTARYLLKRHYLVHGGKVECPVCKKFLSGRTNMSVHLQSHTDERRHKCIDCDKSFNRSSHLKRHVQSAHK
ncbi:unnamed protein product [Leptidea sinapis]|uniref:C2H2-type domain-containing protein n=1 Tax=Leptidea sinapis TaxID=189913 RepID=A0A5E4Q8H9_9NEOP|nr:unnamed protein product [Leptidea sinapis]